MEIIWSIIAIGGLGAGFGILLSYASKKLAVKKDERVAAVRDNLPGANCGGCGFPGCDGFAQAVENQLFNSVGEDVFSNNNIIKEHTVL